MFNFFKKRTLPQPNESEAIFPAAKDMLEKTAKTWPTRTSKEILQKLKYESSSGERSAYFCKSYISDQTRQELEQQGYSVETFTYDNCPAFKIFW